jgi:hypothetical protein
LGDAISDPPDSFHEGSVGAKLLSQAFHVGVERSAVGRVAVTPDGAEKVVTILCFSGALAEEEEKLEFGRCQFGRLVVEVEFE